MVAEIDYKKCTLCGSYSEPICVDKCPINAITLRNKKVEVTEFLCEDCNECGCACPDNAIKIIKVTW
ncbi:MAG: ferredoxin [Planctomycetes bacterium]|nr:ferredoxin [Planctomycetota bacterium]